MSRGRRICPQFFSRKGTTYVCSRLHWCLAFCSKDLTFVPQINLSILKNICPFSLFLFSTVSVFSLLLKSASLLLEELRKADAYKIFYMQKIHEHSEFIPLYRESILKAHQIIKIFVFIFYFYFHKSP